MDSTGDRAVAIVGIGAILPDAPDVSTFWKNICGKHYSIAEVPPERWSIADYYDPDPSVPDKTYSKIGGWVRDFQFDWKQYRIPPRVAAAMDEGQQWAVTIAAQALADYGYPARPLDTERTGVILGTAMGGERHYVTGMRLFFPEYAHLLGRVDEFRQLPAGVQKAIVARWRENVGQYFPSITEDTMPGELANIVSGRIANIFNLRGPNFIADAACASSLAAIDAGIENLVQHHCDAVLTGGVDHNMGVSSFIKFCKIGALSATGTRPFGDGADGFVMGEGSAAFLLKRLADAERDGDKVYAVIRGVGASSDGKGKGITAPNPVGQQLAISRAWQNAGLDPAAAGLVEAHGTSTRVGDVVEVESLTKVFCGGRQGSIALGSVKSNIGHLKAGAGAAGVLKTVLALHDRVLPPTLHADPPNPNIDFRSTPFYLSHELREWPRSNGETRRAGVSAYGFGGTNFHMVMEEHVPGALTQKRQFTGASFKEESVKEQSYGGATAEQALKPPIRGILALGGDTHAELTSKLAATLRRVQEGWLPQGGPARCDLANRERLVLDFGTRDELLDRIAKAQKVLELDNPQAWKALQAQGLLRGTGPRPGKIAFLFPGQGSQYVNMGRELAGLQPAVAEVFADADQVMTPILGKPLTAFIFVDAKDPDAVKQAEKDLMQTAITQPSMLTADIAFARLLGEYGFKPDMVMGHSLGEYAALIASDIMPFADALEAAAARGREMAKLSPEDNGWMAAVLAPYDVVQQTLKEIDGYVVPANINSYSQCVIGGSSKAVERAIEVFTQKGFQAQRIPVSHAFHTRIVALASGPLRQVLNRLRIAPPRLPIIANVTGDFYPTTVEEIKDILQQQIASPVQWVKGLETLYAAGARTFVEVGPKKALKGFVDDVLASKPDVVGLFTNYPKVGELATFNQALCGLYAAGYGVPEEQPVTVGAATRPANGDRPAEAATASPAPQAAAREPGRNGPSNGDSGQVVPAQPVAPPSIEALGQIFAQALGQLTGASTARPAPSRQPYDRNEVPVGSVVITGTGLGLPGPDKPVMAPDNVMRLFRGEQLIDLMPERFRKLQVDKRITRVVKGEDGSGRFETIQSTDDVIKLAGRAGYFNLTEEYGVPEKLVEALDTTSQLAIAAGLDALREAGIPLVQTWRQTTTGKFLPDRWLLPEAMRDETGVIFASVFPGLDRFADELVRYFTWQNRLEQVAMLEDLRLYTTDPDSVNEINRRLAELHEALDREPYAFDRRFIFRMLSMGHSQFAEYIGARGPNTQVNAACATTAQAVGVAEDWIRSGRCRRVLVIAGDNVSSDRMLEWFGAGMLATGAAATDDRTDEAALPFDRRRHGMIFGMGACALVLESEDAVRERGMRGIAELISTEIENSAFHGTRLDVEHIAGVMDKLITSAERRFGVDRYTMAPRLAFMSHETYTPARGGSASAEVGALRHTFGPAASEIVMTNTKGFTGHTIGVGVEDVMAIKILEHGLVPPVANFKEVDPELGPLTLSRGGRYPVQYALHLAAGFGSQICMTLARRIPGPIDRVTNKGLYDRWLADVSGYDRAEMEVVKRVLRVKSNGTPPRVPAASTWQYGTGPAVRALVPGEVAGDGFRPAPMVMPVPATTVTTWLGGDGKEKQAEPSRVEAARPAAQPQGDGARAATAPRVEPAAPLPPVAVAPAAPVVASPATPARVVAAAPVAAPVVAAPVPALAPAAPSVDPVKSQVMQIVAGKTGYPQDMLDLDLDLEADLGIDTVKQAETFVAIREAFSIPRVEGLKLRDYPTLAAVIQFVHDSRPDLAQPVAPPAPSPVVEAAPAAPAAPAVAAPVPAPAPAASAGDLVKIKVLEIVAGKTGYPEDMLDLDLDLEADLGVDTVKQAETFVAIREAFNIPRVEGLKLRDYPTLSAVIQFVQDRRPDLAQAAAPAAPAASVAAAPAPASAAVPAVAPAAAPAAPAEDPVKVKVLEIVAGKTGYPEDMLDLDLDLEADLGVDTVKQAETFVAIREAFSIPRVEGLKLRDYPTLSHVIQFVHDNRPDLAQAAPPAVPAEPAAEAAAPAVSPEQPPAPAAIAGAPAVPPGEDPVKAEVLKIVAAKTGYPEDMLDLDLDLEADLGVDTVKQAETFVAIREKFSIPRVEGLKLRDYPTLASVIQFVHDMRPDLGAPASGADGEGAAVAAAPTRREAAAAAPVPMGSIEEANKIPRRVPVPAVRPPLDICKPTGVTLDEKSRVIVAADRGGVGKALINRLQKRGVTALVIDEPIDGDAVDVKVKGWLAEGPIQGVYWLPALDAEPGIEEMDVETWRELNRQRVKNLYVTMRALYESVAGPDTFLISATRLGGLHGYGKEGATAPLGGAVVGFTKAYKRERNEALVKAVDFETGRETARPAEMLIAETLGDPGVVEVGYRDGLRYTITLQEQPVDGGPGMELTRDTVFLVTGAAGGITSAIVTDLAVASGGKFYLLDLVQAPRRDDPDIALFRQDKEALKRKLIDQMKAAGERPTPVQVDKRVFGIERQEAALRAIEAVEAAGGTAHYHSVNLLDGQAVAAVIDDVRQRYGRIDVLLHAGGMEISRSLPDKEPREFELVFDVKADGFFNLLKAARGLPIGATVAFSSVAGRFGNAGQVDYSAANDLLCKITSSMRSWRPATRGIVIDWTAWGGIGMATRGSIPKIMEMAGIDMLPPESGIPTIRRELTCGSFRGELLVGQRLGFLVQEWDPEGGLDTQKVKAWLAAREQPALMVGEMKAAKLYGGLEVETTLDPEVQPFLFDHQIDGVPVLPGVMGTEAFAELAGLLVPGYRVGAIKNEHFSAPFKFYRHQPRTLYLNATISPLAQGELLAHAVLKSITQLPGKAAESGMGATQEKVHFTADVYLTCEPPPAPVVAFEPPDGEGVKVDKADIYQAYFHGPAYQVLDRVQVNGDRAVGLMSQALPADTSPVDVEQRMAPRLIELCFQTAGVWEIATRQMIALPASIDSVTVYRQPQSAEGRRLFSVVEAVKGGEAFDAQVVDEAGNVYVTMSGYHTLQIPNTVTLK